MNALNVLVIEQISNSKELEKILINQGINTVTSNFSITRGNA